MLASGGVIYWLARFCAEDLNERLTRQPVLHSRKPGRMSTERLDGIVSIS